MTGTTVRGVNEDTKRFAHCWHMVLGVMTVAAVKPRRLTMESNDYREVCVQLQRGWKLRLYQKRARDCRTMQQSKHSMMLWTLVILCTVEL